MSPPDTRLELELYRFLNRVRAPLQTSRNADQALRSVLRSTIPFLGADAGCIATMQPGETAAQVQFRVPVEATFPMDSLAAPLRGEWPSLPPSMLIAIIRRRGRPWGVMALQKNEGSFAQGRGRALARIADSASELVQNIDRERLREVRLRIDQKLMEELRGKDLFYQILKGLRSLTSYDHSSALLVPGEQQQSLIFEAEQIAFKKAKSQRIGLRLPTDDAISHLLTLGEVFGFERQRDDGPWLEWTDFDAAAIGKLLDSATPALPSNRKVPPERSMLCASIAGRDGSLGLLKIASRSVGTLGPYEADLVKRFLPHAAVAIQNTRRTETLRESLQAAERRTAMADLSRSVAHDVNNALGAVLPIVQQIRKELEDGEEVDPEQLFDDMAQIERSLVVCRRIFGGMLSFARGHSRHHGTSNLEHSIDAALTILQDGMNRKSIHREIDVEPDLPAIATDQSELDRLVFNLLANARDAMRQGGTLTLSGRLIDGEGEPRRVELLVGDTGEGIAPEDLPRIQEPFFTTKKQGSGLGLSIVRNIVWEMRGELRFESDAGKGTTVRVRLPVRIEDDMEEGTTE